MSAPGTLSFDVRLVGIDALAELSGALAAVAEDLERVGSPDLVAVETAYNVVAAELDRRLAKGRERESRRIARVLAGTR